jgi:hypothetical protein
LLTFWQMYQIPKRSQGKPLSCTKGFINNLSPWFVHYIMNTFCQISILENVFILDHNWCHTLYWTMFIYT